MSSFALSKVPAINSSTSKIFPKKSSGNLKINSNGCEKKPNMTERTTPTGQRGSPPKPLPTGLLRFSRDARPQKDFAAWTQLENVAVRTIGHARITTPPSVPDQPMTPIRPVLTRHQPHQIALDLFRVFMLC